MTTSKSRLKKPRIKPSSVMVVVFSVLLMLLFLGLHLNREGIIYLPDFLVPHLQTLSVVIATFFLISLFLRLTIKRVVNFFDEAEEKIFYSKIYSWVLYSVGIFFLLNKLGVSLGNITLFIGLLATGLAFAVRDVLLSFFGWIILLRKKPFRIGDHIRIGELEGKVLHIGTFHVLLDNTPDFQEDYIRVPNRLFIEQSIINLGKTHCHEKISLQLSSIPGRDLLIDAQTGIANVLGEGSHALVRLDVEGDRPIIRIGYLVPFQQREQMKNEVILYLNHVLSGFLFFQK